MVINIWFLFRILHSRWMWKIIFPIHQYFKKYLLSHQSNLKFDLWDTTLIPSWFFVQLFCQVLHDFSHLRTFVPAVPSGKSIFPHYCSRPPLSFTNFLTLRTISLGCCLSYSQKLGLDNHSHFTHNITIELCADQLWNFSCPIILLFPSIFQIDSQLSDESNCLNHTDTSPKLSTW